MIGKKKASSDGSSVARDAGPRSKRREERSDQSEDDVKHSPSKWHDKCIASYEGEDRKKIKKKPKKTYPKEVVRFVEGYRYPEGDGIKKDPMKHVRKSPRYSTEVRFLEHKFIQCNITRANGEAEMSLPEEIKPLLINVTFLLHELKSKNLELSCAISKIVTFLAELSKRPIKRSDERNEHAKQFEEFAEKLGSVLKERNGPDDEKYGKLVSEVKYLEQEVTEKDLEVNYVKEQIKDEQARLMPPPSSLDDSLRNSILKNHSLKAEIKYNKAQFRKYSSLMAQKEQAKQKSLIELSNLKRKFAKLEVNPQYRAKQPPFNFPNSESEVFHGGSVTKYIKSKIPKDKRAKKKAPRVTGKICE